VVPNAAIRGVRPTEQAMRNALRLKVVVPNAAIRGVRPTELEILGDGHSRL
jgi:hypothetical protein